MFPLPSGLGLYLKLGLLALAFTVGLGGGCKWQAARDAGKLEAQAKAHAKVVDKKNKALTVASAQLAADANQFLVLADTLNQVSANTALELSKAAAQAERGRLAAEQAQRDRRLYLLRLSELDQAREKAKADSPQCRAQLEAPLCVDLL